MQAEWHALFPCIFIAALYACSRGLRRVLVEGDNKTVIDLSFVALPRCTTLPRSLLEVQHGKHACFLRRSVLTTSAVATTRKLMLLPIEQLMTPSHCRRTLPPSRNTTEIRAATASLVLSSGRARLLDHRCFWCTPAQAPGESPERREATRSSG